MSKEIKTKNSKKEPLRSLKQKRADKAAKRRENSSESKISIKRK